MHIHKNIKRTAAFALTGVVAVSLFAYVSQGELEEGNAVSGSWGNFVSTAWMNESDARYKKYTDMPGSSESSPYLIKTAEEFSGIRAFEGGDALAGKYIMLANDIDLSAHYWDPIELYGYGDSEDDMFDIDYADGLWVPEDDEVVHFDGNSMDITGLTILNGYDEVLVFANEPWDDYPWPVEAGSTGLFSFAYKARIANVNLVSPSITLNKTSGIEATGAFYWSEHKEIDVIDIAGTVVGASHNSRIVDTHVTNPQLSYTALFGEALSDEDYPEYYSPNRIITGGAVGYAFGQTVTSNTSVKGGAMDVKPAVDYRLVEYPDGEDGYYNPGMEALYDGGVSIGGVVGHNFQSVILSTCNDSDITFSDEKYAIIEDPAAEQEAVGYYNIFAGGITGYSSAEYSFQACVYNSCAHSNISIESHLFENAYVGGIVGLLENDSMINNFFDGEISASQEEYLGEIVGAAYMDSDKYTVKANHHLNRGIGAYGDFYDERSESNPENDAFTTITTADKLVADLNAGRALVIQDSLGHVDGELSKEFLNKAVTAWAIQDGTGRLDCSGTMGVGLVFPDNRIDVPNTGAK